MRDAEFDVVVIGAGAAGLMCAIEAGKQGRHVALLDHGKKIAEKIRISGGGRCNFTNLGIEPRNYLSANPHFCKSALKQYTQHDFIALVEKHGIAYHEKTLGQLFCDNRAQDIIDMLLAEAADAKVSLQTEIDVTEVKRHDEGFHLGCFDKANEQPYALRCKALVIATGGLSISKIGASKFGYEVAKQFGLPVLQTRAALVPLTFQSDLLARCAAMSGLAVDAIVKSGKTAFQEGLLFTHRGLSGPSILQISSYWREGGSITLNLAPGHDAAAHLQDSKAQGGKQGVVSALSDIVPKRLAQDLCQAAGLEGRLSEIGNKALAGLGRAVNEWQLTPAGSEGYRTAEVTLGGVDTDALSSKTMQAKHVSGLFFIGEVVDVTGHLGGYNFQWAWSSGYVAGQYAGADLS